MLTKLLAHLASKILCPCIAACAFVLAPDRALAAEGLSSTPTCLPRTNRVDELLAATRSIQWSTDSAAGIFTPALVAFAKARPQQVAATALEIIHACRHERESRNLWPRRAAFALLDVLRLPSTLASLLEIARESSADSLVRRSALGVLFDIAGRDSDKLLAEVLASEKDTRVGLWAVRLLGRTGTMAAKNTLESMRGRLQSNASMSTAFSEAFFLLERPGLCRLKHSQRVWGVRVWCSYLCPGPVYHLDERQFAWCRSFNEPVSAVDVQGPSALWDSWAES